MSGVTVENSTLALSGDHAKEGELLQVKRGTGWEAACQEVDKGSRGSWIKSENSLNCHLVVEVKHLKLLFVEDKGGKPTEEHR